MKGHRARTKDETFMVRLFEQASAASDMSAVFDRYQIGVLAGLQPKGVDTICTLLCQANFIKKISAAEVSITPHGIKLVERILSE